MGQIIGPDELDGVSSGDVRRVVHVELPLQSDVRCKGFTELSDSAGRVLRNKNLRAVLASSGSQLWSREFGRYTLDAKPHAAFSIPGPA